MLKGGKTLNLFSPPARAVTVLSRSGVRETTLGGNQREEVKTVSDSRLCVSSQSGCLARSFKISVVFCSGHLVLALGEDGHTQAT